MATRWGIASAGKISSDFAGAITSQKSEHRLVAVAARSVADAQAFAKKHGAEKAYGSYVELAKDPNVEVVYVGSINPCHHEVASLMINAGKHVLCEKPLCMNVKETKQLVDLARQKKVFLMEAVWSRFFPVYQELKKKINAGEIGEVVQVMASFGQCLSHVDRVSKKALGGGGILDLGVYCVQFASFVMGGEKPLKVVASGHMNSEGVDETTSSTIVYSNGRVATLNTSIRCTLPCEGIVIGTKGTLKVRCPIWCPISLESPSGNFDSPLPDYGKSFNFLHGQGMMFEAAEVRRCLKEGLLESPTIKLEESLIIAETMEAMRKQVGVIYPQDA